MFATYSATKAFLFRWSKALRAELEPRGVDVQILMPMYVTSNMSKIRRSSFFVPSEFEYARSAVRSFGRCHVHTCHFSHALLVAGACFLPESLGISLTFGRFKW